ncbi:MAG TPA: M23 family metallopeptidase [Vicinamibacterales bacterium]|nr:M23 family metallopeptidase [Vicinamibacterales bacterium]
MVEFRDSRAGGPPGWGRRRVNRLVSKRYTLVLADRTTGVVRRFTLSLWPTLGTTVAVLSLPILVGLGARWSARATIDDLRSANASLVLENESYREATAQLSTQIAALQSAVDDIGARAAVDPAASRAMQKLPAVVTARAMGGGSTGPSLSPVLDGAFGQADAAFGVMRELLAVIASRLDSVRFGVERRQALAGATPSVWPVTGWLSSAYGNRRDPFTGDANFHPGLDISASHGEPVLATADGVVTSAGSAGNYGNLVVIDHGFGIVTKYGHLSRFAVMTGQEVRRGAVIGHVGSTGRSTSPHLHYEIWMNERLINPLRLLGPR